MAGDGDDAVAPETDETTAPGAAGGPTCPHCQEPLYKRHCKYVCPQHGVVFDCSDTFWL